MQILGFDFQKELHDHVLKEDEVDDAVKQKQGGRVLGPEAARAAAVRPRKWQDERHLKRGHDAREQERHYHLDFISFGGKNSCYQKVKSLFDQEVRDVGM